MNNAYVFLFLFIVFGSLISGSYFNYNITPVNLNFVSSVLAEESSNDDESDSGDQDETDKETDDNTDEQTDDNTDEQTDDNTDDENCQVGEEKEAGAEDEQAGEECNETETDKEIDDNTNEQTDDNTDEQNDETNEQTDDNTDEQTDDETEQIQEDETASSITTGEEHTILDEILSDGTLLEKVIGDKTTEPELVSTLLSIQEQQDAMSAETCGNEIDDDNDGSIDEEECVVPPTEVCDNGSDDDNDGSIDEEDCVVPPTEVCDNGSDDDTDGKTDSQDEDCPTVIPTVVIESAKYQTGKTLSSGDLITPGEVTFTFSAKTNQTSQSQDNLYDYKFECALDGKSFNSCNSPETVELDDGKYTFVVRLAS